jgi:hypothetical protein
MPQAQRTESASAEHGGARRHTGTRLEYSRRHSAVTARGWPRPRRRVGEKSEALAVDCIMQASCQLSGFSSRPDSAEGGELSLTYVLTVACDTFVTRRNRGLRPSFLPKRYAGGPRVAPRRSSRCAKLGQAGAGAVEGENGSLRDPRGALESDMGFGHSSLVHAA